MPSPRQKALELISTLDVSSIGRFDNLIDTIAAAQDKSAAMNDAHAAVLARPAGGGAPPGGAPSLTPERVRQSMTLLVALLGLFDPQQLDLITVLIESVTSRSDRPGALTVAANAIDAGANPLPLANANAKKL